MASAKPNATAARIMTRPAEEDAPPAIDGAYSPVRASRPNDVTATPAKAHCPIGRVGPRGVAGEPPSDRVSVPLPIIRAMNVVIEGYSQPPALLDDAGAGAAGAVPPEPLEPPLTVNELTDVVTSLPVGSTSHHLAPNWSLPCPEDIPGPESPT